MSSNDVEVSGEQNRVAGRDFIEINVGAKSDERALLPAQRKKLHQLRAKCEELGDDPRDVWREVHTQLSVTSLDEVTATQFVQARGVIQARLERQQEEADRKRLIAKILRAADEKDARHALSNFCELAFGRTQLSLLKRAELPKALEFIQQFEAKPTSPSAAPSAAAKLELREFLITYHWNAVGLFIFGLLVGGLWF
ncbi:hypothetical protein [Pseudomonas leptonychotis]|uniref:hypothetical protein n=1 Tax=Pseudomonas leptonychotis TaxID=2448482 RepID=UPI003866C316